MLNEMYLLFYYVYYFQDFTEIKVLQDLFPETHLLLCTFHVIKWFKGLLATSKTSVEEKKKMFDSWRELVYARDESDYNSRLEKWEELIQGVMIKVGSGAKAHYVCLSEYCEKNWYPCRQMWARFERKSLPMGTEHTTNRLERSFGVMKADLKVNTFKEVTIEAAVMHIVNWADRKLVTASTMALRKEVRIYHPNSEIQEQLSIAAVHLNKTGCVLFKRSLELLEKNEKRMTMNENGILERFNSKAGDNSKKFYNTTEKSCNCSGWAQDVLVCRHI